MSRRRDGFALLEVLVALTILAMTGLSLVEVARQATRSQAEMEREEQVMREANRVLTAMTLLKGSELDRSIGAHPVGEFTVSVQRPERGLYRIAIARNSATERQLLATVVYKGGSQERTE